MTDLDNIFTQVRTERERQDRQWGGWRHDQEHNANDWIALIVKHAGKAAYAPVGSGEYHEAMIKVAALAIAAAQFTIHDPKRQEETEAREEA